MTAKAKWSRAWRAQRHPNFRLLFLGQSIFVIGTGLRSCECLLISYRIFHLRLIPHGRSREKIAAATWTLSNNSV